MLSVGTAGGCYTVGAAECALQPLNGVTDLWASPAQKSWYWL